MRTPERGLIGLAPRRRLAGYTQQSFAGALNVSRSLVAAWEVGRVWPSAVWLPELARLLGCSVDELYRPPEEPETMLSQEEA